MPNSIYGSLCPIRHAAVLLFFIFIGCKSGYRSGQLPPGSSITAVRSADPNDLNFEDLDGFRKAIGNARVVLLGEQTHGEGATFLAKTRLIKFLHDSLSFDVLAFESGLYDCTRIYENIKNGADLQEEVKGSLFYMYAASQQTRPLFGYIQTSLKTPRPLILAGFESQHTGAKAIHQLFTDFEIFLKSLAPEQLDETWNLFKQVSVSMFKSRSFRPAAQEKELFFKKLASLKKRLPEAISENATSLLQSPGYWNRILASIESQALRYWDLVNGNEVSVRDEQMANNLIWLADKAFPGKKIIVWSHNIHIAKRTDQLIFPTQNPAKQFFSTFTPMGNKVGKHFREQSYSIGFTSSAGSYQNYTNDQFIDVPTPSPLSIESRFSNTGYPFAFTDLRQPDKWWRQAQTGMLYDFMPVQGNWQEVYDGIFFIRKNYPVDR